MSRRPSIRVRDEVVKLSYESKPSRRHACDPHTDGPSVRSPRMVAATQSGLSGPRLGVLGFGDSITNGGGELQWGVALQSWAMWTARSLGLPFTSYATDGAGVAEVAELQLAAASEQSAHPEARYDLGCL